MGLILSARQTLARNLRRARAFERKTILPDPKVNDRRSRSLEAYQRYLRGLWGTLTYINQLPVRRLIDIGAGTGQAIAELKKTQLGKDLDLVGTGLIWDSAIAIENYRITSAEVMRGFMPNTVGGIISVFGPLHYSDSPELVLEKMDELLIPDGVIKLCIMKHIPEGDESRNQEHAAMCSTIEKFFYEKRYGLAIRDWEIINRRGVSRAILAIKGRGAGSQNQCATLAETLMKRDEACLAVIER